MEHDVVAGVERLASALRAAAPSRVTVELEPAAPADLGWSTVTSEVRAWRLTVWAPSGACRALGLLPRAEMRADADADGFLPGVVAVGPELIVVAAPPPEVAMTADALDDARPLLARACAPIEAWAAGVEVRPPEVAGAQRVVRAPHALWIELAPDAPELELEPLWAQGVEVVVHQRSRADGPPEPQAVALRPYPPSR